MTTETIGSDGAVARTGRFGQAAVATERILERVEDFAQTQGVIFPGGPKGSWLPVDALLDILGEREVRDYAALWDYGVRRRNGVDEYPDAFTARRMIGRKGQDGERQWLVRRRPGIAPGAWEAVASQ